MFFILGTENVDLSYFFYSFESSIAKFAICKNNVDILHWWDGTVMRNLIIKDIDCEQLYQIISGIINSIIPVSSGIGRLSQDDRYRVVQNLFIDVYRIPGGGIG